MATAIVYSKKYLEHNPGWEHPERPQRLEAIVDGLKKAGLWDSRDVKVIAPKPASRKDIELVHDPEYVSLVEKLSASQSPLDGDTPTHHNTFEIALLSAGGAIEAGKLVTSGDFKNAFALLRPPGHHAFKGHGGGFCYFNNMAIMVESLKRDLQRVLILDIDAHHGNGTQDIFYEDPNVLYMSIHQHPSTLYPGTGFPEETGVGAGEGYKVNVPVPPGSGDEEYAAIMHEIFAPLAGQFQPELIAVSAGFDGHARDPLTSLQLSSNAYGWIANIVLEQAEQLCRGKAVFLLEGGYDLQALSEGVTNIVKAMGGEKFQMPAEKRPKVIDDVKKALGKKWMFGKSAAKLPRDLPNRLDELRDLIR
jgi:acetoin utilization deacetylase AcuC-like enzyme